MMLRAVWLTIGKEFLLIRRDRVGLFMLILAPIAVIAAAGFSLAKIYGGRGASRGGDTISGVGGEPGAVGGAGFAPSRGRPGRAGFPPPRGTRAGGPGGGGRTPPGRKSC